MIALILRDLEITKLPVGENRGESPLNFQRSSKAIPLRFIAPDNSEINWDTHDDGVSDGRIYLRKVRQGGSPHC